MRNYSNFANHGFKISAEKYPPGFMSIDELTVTCGLAKAEAEVLKGINLKSILITVFPVLLILQP
jgi:hypothetical protein